MFTKKEIVQLLETGDEIVTEDLYRAAREARGQTSGSTIFLYGFIYFSTYCRNDCAFCYYRRSNGIGRYRKEPDEILATARALADSGVGLLDLTMGEDPFFRTEGYDAVCGLIRRIKAETGLPVMISPGVVEDDVIDRLAQSGADWFALYQETHDRDLFSRLRTGQDYDLRMHAKLRAREAGLLIEEGILAGVGETAQQIADSLLEMGRIGARQMRVMSFVPQKGSPMEQLPTPDRSLELKIIALLRVLYPDVLIPASLDVDGLAGLRSRIDAGANVVTSLIPPQSGFAGVAQKEMDVEEGGRTAKEAGEVLRSMGLEPATPAAYLAYLERLRAR